MWKHEGNFSEVSVWSGRDGVDIVGVESDREKKIHRN